MNHSLISDVGMAILGTTVLGLIAHIFRLPLIAMYILTGIALGQSMGFGFISDPVNIQTLSEIGFILLMFTLGIEIDLRKLRHAGKAVLVTGPIQVTVSMALIWGVFFLIGPEIARTAQERLYVAMAIALSSTVIIVKMLSDRMEIGLLSSRITIGVAIVQDLFAIAFLSFQSSFGSWEFQPLLIAGAKVLVLVSAAFILSRYILPKLFSTIEAKPELVILAAMAWCFSMASLSNSLKLSKEMGALLAGISVASLPYHAEVSSRVIHLRDFFTTLFFVSLGLRLPIPGASTGEFVILVILLVYASRLITVWPSLRILGHGHRTSFFTAINLSQVSEFAIVLAAIGIKYGHVGPTLFYGLIWAFVVTSILSSLIIPNNDTIYRTIRPLLEKLGIEDRWDVQPPKPSQPSSTVISFLGFQQTGSSLLRELETRFSKEFTRHIQIFDHNPETLRLLRRDNYDAHYVDLSHPETILRFAAEESEIILCTIPDHMLKGMSNLTLVKFFRRRAPEAHIIVTAETLAMAQELYKAGASYVSMPRLITSSYLADVIERLKSGEAPHIRQNAQEHIAAIKETLP